MSIKPSPFPPALVNRLGLAQVTGLPQISPRSILSAVEVAQAQADRAQATNAMKATAEALAALKAGPKKAQTVKALAEAEEAYKSARNSFLSKTATKLHTFPAGHGVTIPKESKNGTGTVFIRARDGGVYLPLVDKDGWYAVRLSDEGASRLLGTVAATISTTGAGLHALPAGRYSDEDVKALRVSRDKGSISRLFAGLLPVADTVDNKLEKVRTEITAALANPLYVSIVTDENRPTFVAALLADANERNGTTYTAEDLEDKPAPTGDVPALFE